MLGEDLTIPRNRGIFLPITWRLSPAICAFTSELFYASRLASRPTLERQVLTGLKELAGSGLWCLDVAHDGRTSSSDEEVFARIRHRPFPGGRLLRTPALVMGMAYYRLRDLL